MKKQLLFSLLLLVSYTAWSANHVKERMAQRVFETTKGTTTQESKKTAKALEKTFAILKPDAVKAKHAGEIIRLIELNNFTILRMQKVRLTKKQAQKFYAIHKNKPFYKDLVSYMTSGPVVILALEKENAIKDWRELMGATDPKKAAPGTLRKMFGTSISSNATHGSDSTATAEQELFFFFPDLN